MYSTKMTNEYEYHETSKLQTNSHEYQSIQFNWKSFDNFDESFHFDFVRDQHLKNN